MQLAREGQGAPSGAGGFRDNFRIAGINELNQVAFSVSLDDASGAYVLFVGGASGTTELARTHQAAPDGNGRLSDFLVLGSRVFNDSGEIVFRASLEDTDAGQLYDQGIYLAGDELLQIARAGQPAPDGRAFQSFSAGQVVNNASQVAFYAATQSGSDYSAGIFLGDGNSPLATIVQRGDVAPDGNGEFERFSSGVINDRGEVGFSADMDFPSGPDGEGIFRSDSSGHLLQIARSGDPAPDGNGVFGGFSELSLRDDGELTFVGWFTGTASEDDETGIYRGDGVGDLVQVVRSGQASPDGDGTIVTDFDAGISTNRKGEIAFLSLLQDTSSGSPEDHAIYFVDNELNLLTVARRGDELLGSTITSLGLDGDNLNELGQVAYRFQLADGRRGIALWSIPEPRAATLALLGLLVAACMRRVS
jgi:hypothetical protein